MAERQSTYDAGERLPDLTAEEVRAVTEWARRVKGTGQPMLLQRCPESNEVIALVTSETERP